MDAFVFHGLVRSDYKTTSNMMYMYVVVYAKNHFLVLTLSINSDRSSRLTLYKTFLRTEKKEKRCSKFELHVIRERYSRVFLADTNHTMDFLSATIQFSIYHLKKKKSKCNFSCCTTEENIHHALFPHLSLPELTFHATTNGRGGERG